MISFFTLVLGELAPKRLALQRPEKAAMLAAPTLDRISLLARPWCGCCPGRSTWWSGSSAVTRPPGAR